MHQYRFFASYLVGYISDKNKEKNLEDISIESPKKIIWECKNGHTFTRGIRDEAFRIKTNLEQKEKKIIYTALPVKV